MRRRSFIQAAAGLSAAAAAAQNPSNIRLGFDSYSIRAFQWKATGVSTFSRGGSSDKVIGTALEIEMGNQFGMFVDFLAD